MSGFKVKMNFDSNKLKKILKVKQDLLNHNVFTIIEREALPQLIDKIMEGYDRLGDRMTALPEDPTNPANWRQEFENKLYQDLERNLIVTDKGLIVKLGDKEFLGYSDAGQSDNSDTTPLVWLVYYLEGLMGEWAFIDTTTYANFRPDADSKPLGRFGDGFLISRTQFEEEGWHEVTSFDEARHPFSGYSPVDIFTEALNEFQFKPFIQRAIKASKEGKRL